MAELSGALIYRQADYSRSPLAIASAAKIISLKIRNSSWCLAGYQRSLERAGSEASAIIANNRNILDHLASVAANSCERSTLFQVEAHAARHYWSAISLICHQDIAWCRFYPHAHDSLNLAFNSGYTFLARQVAASVSEVGLLPQLGLLHGENSGLPLVYDLMECFRHIAVDMVVLPVFSRHRRTAISDDDPRFKKLLAKLAKHYEQKFYYHGRHECLSRIIKLEAMSLKRAIMANQVWSPYQFPRGHHH